MDGTGDEREDQRDGKYLGAPPHDPSRRRFLSSAAGVLPAGLLATSASGCQDAPSNDRRLTFRSLDEALRELDQLIRVEALKPATVWNWAQTLVHCAQSIEYSLTGFPQPKSEIFRRTLGAAAFTVFSWRGRMSHDLGEPIPGAPALEAGADSAAAEARLRRAVHDFEQRAEPLRPHFAYGELSRSEYAQAHAMHLANHFSAFGQKA